MVKKTLVLAVLAVFCAASFIMAADEAKKAAPAVPAAPSMAAGNAAQPMQYPKPEFSMLTGKVEKIDSSDPANIRITVKNDKDGVSHTLTVMPWTNITKSAVISDLKNGEAVRVMGRKTQDKEIAMGIMFGKINVPPMAPGQAAAPAKEPVKK